MSIKNDSAVEMHRVKIQQQWNWGKQGEQPTALDGKT